MTCRVFGIPQSFPDPTHCIFPSKWKYLLKARPLGVGQREVSCWWGKPEEKKRMELPYGAQNRGLRIVAARGLPAVNDVWLYGDKFSSDDKCRSCSFLSWENCWSSHYFSSSLSSSFVLWLTHNSICFYMCICVLVSCLFCFHPRK